jgi:hypothetical protein
LSGAWVKLGTLVSEDARKQFTEREKALSEASKRERAQQERRTLLSKEDFVRMMQRSRQQFESALPLKIRSSSYEFSHKTLFEYFVAKQPLQLDEKADISLEEKLGALMDRLTASIYDFEILLFLHEGWKEQMEKQLKIASMLEAYSGDENSKRVFNLYSNTI